MLLTGDPSSLSDVKLNWTNVLKSVEDYVDLMSRFAGPRNIDWSPFNVTAIDMKWTDFVEGMKSLESIGTDK